VPCAGKKKDKKVLHLRRKGTTTNGRKEGEAVTNSKGKSCGHGGGERKSQSGKHKSMGSLEDRKNYGPRVSFANSPEKRGASLDYLKEKKVAFVKLGEGGCTIWERGHGDNGMGTG